MRKLDLSLPSLRSSYFATFFFFQAEDGIRDHCVTGVQTCALPISGLVDRAAATRREHDPLAVRRHRRVRVAHRSEERRVGKEWRNQELLLHDNKLNRSGQLAENEKIRPILAQLEQR